MLVLAKLNSSWETLNIPPTFAGDSEGQVHLLKISGADASFRKIATLQPGQRKGICFNDCAACCKATRAIQQQGAFETIQQCSSSAPGAVVASACPGSGVCVAAALSSGRLLVHTLSNAGLCGSSSGEGPLSYMLEADNPLPAAASQLVFLSSLPALALAAACGSRHVQGLCIPS